MTKQNQKMLGLIIKLSRGVYYSLCAFFAFTAIGTVGVVYYVSTSDAFVKTLSTSITHEVETNTFSTYFGNHFIQHPAILSLLVGIFILMYTLIFMYLLRRFDDLATRLKNGNYFAKENVDTLKSISKALLILAISEAILNITLPVTLLLTSFFVSVLADLINDATLLKDEQSMVI